MLLALGGAKLVFHLLTGETYGFHRDELYYLVGGRRLDLGYVDHPPLVPWLAALSEALFGLSLRGLHVLPAIAGSGIVVLAGWMASRMGGGRYAQALAAAAALCSPLYLASNALFQTVTFDQLAWAAALAVLVVILGEPSAQQTAPAGRDESFWPWLLLGLVFGIGMLVKYTILALGAAVAGVLAATRERRRLGRPWPWLAAALALLLALPNLLWQRAHGWPTLEFIAGQSARHRTGAVDFLGEQLLQLGPFSFPVYVAGFLWLLGRRAGALRMLGFLVVTVFGLFLLVGAKPYYPGPLYALLFAAGGVYLEPRFVRSPLPGSLPRLLRAAPFALLAGNLLPLPFFVPVLPPEVYAALQERLDNDDFDEMFGWRELAETVDEAYRGLPHETRRRTGIFTSSYGSAAAIDLFGASRGLPPAASGHNSYWFWTRGAPLDPVLVVGYGRESAERLWEEVHQVGVVGNAFGVENEEYGRPVFFCRGRREDPAELWPRLRHFD